MENKFYTDDLELLLKEKSDEFRMYPSRRVWHSIYNDRHPSRRWPSVAISMILVFVLLLVGYMNTSDTDISNNTPLLNIETSSPSEPVVTSYRDAKRWKSAERKARAAMYGDDDQAPTADAASEDAAATTFIAIVPPVYSITDEVMTTPGTTNDNITFNQNNNNNNYFNTGIDAAASGNVNNKTETVVRNNPAAPGQRTNTLIAANNNKPASASPVTAASNSNAAGQNTTTATGSNSRNPASASTQAIASNRPVNSNGNNRVRRSNPATEDANAIATNSGRNNRRKPAGKDQTTTSGKENNNEEDLVITADPNKKTNAGSTATNLLQQNSSNKTADADKKNDNASALLTSVAKTGLSEEDKAWIDDFALHNKPPRKKWKDVVSMEFYATPSMSYRSMSGNVNKPSAAPFANNDISDYSRHRPGIGLEAGVGVAYAFAKRLRFKAGVQFNYTNFGIKASETSHPSLVSLLMNDRNTGYSYSSARSTSLANVNTESGQPVTLRNRTYQVSVPLGLAFKLAGNKKMEWFAGATIQPSYVFGGNAYLLSADLKNYVADGDAIRRWNFNTGIETYVNYKVGKTTSFQVGPQFRYQLQSTFKDEFTTSEKLYNIGLKLGLVKNF